MTKEIINNLPQIKCPVKSPPVKSPMETEPKDSGLIKKILNLIQKWFLKIANTFSYVTSLEWYKKTTPNITSPNPTPLDPTPPNPNEFPSINWRRVGKSALIIGGVFIASALIYQVTKEYLNSPVSLSNPELRQTLNPLCRRAVESYCQKGITGLHGKEVCLRDYVLKTWQLKSHIFCLSS